MTEKTQPCGCNIWVTPAKICSVHLAGPKLLEACEAALRRLDESLHGQPPSMHAIREYGPLLRSAIAKAKGEKT